MGNMICMRAAPPATSSPHHTLVTEQHIACQVRQYDLLADAVSEPVMLFTPKNEDSVAERHMAWNSWADLQFPLLTRSRIVSVPVL